MRTLWLCGLILLIGGCEQKDPKFERFPVSGKVTLDGKPIRAGRIMFIDPETILDPDQAEIVDGTYKVMAMAGRRRVEVSVNQEVPGKKSPLGGPVYKEAVDPKYNRNTTLEADILPEAPPGNILDFEVKSTP